MRRGFPRRGQSLRCSLDRLPSLQDNAPKLPVLHCPHYLIIPAESDVRSVLPDVHVISSWHAGWCGPGWIDLPCPLQSVCQRMSSPLHDVDLALYADDTAIIATSRKPTLLVSYLESYLNELQRWLSE
jgi:hypothetical protein